MEDNFKSNWKPAIGWVLASILFHHYVIERDLFALFQAFGKELLFPEMSLTEIFSLLGALLGFGGLHTYEHWGKEPNDKIT